MTSRRARRVLEAPAFMLHAQPWRETSLLIRVLTREHGVLTLVAKGAKRPYSSLRAVLGVFQPLLLSWSGAGEIRTLTAAECRGLIPLGGRGLMSAWYMNELLLALLAREDPHPRVFDAYDAALRQLAGVARGEAPLAPSACLRRFEWILLEETGYGLDLQRPDFTDPAHEPGLRQLLHQRLEGLLERPLLTRRVMLDMQARPENHQMHHQTNKRQA